MAEKRGIRGKQAEAQRQSTKYLKRRVFTYSESYLGIIGSLGLTYNHPLLLEL
jgi:hypothetical protein